ncbi:protein POLLEN DEFECTIVE IN GUIDANCE 1-like isoform X2 [Telopea speciosissima]|uniref:protein POLLEN DEFECTIVE IN GUIDANCE 1-like isoform X2 n=1 Tax=Telopea speciosissima TaxID=54955 RepID=UPI001CC59D12|nr:protein POLLEN DEFECTIVE IN GUIDANCE 1-like isoform X2 [Telopea speciosissima]
MGLRSGGRKLSFDILSNNGLTEDEILLYRSNSDPLHHNDGDGDRISPGDNPNRQKKKKKSSKKKKISPSIEEDPVITDKAVDSVFDNQESFFYENSSCTNGLDSNFQSCRIQTVIYEEVTVKEDNGATVRTVHQVSEPEFPILHGDRTPFPELRQRNVNGGGGCEESVLQTDEPDKAASSAGLNSSAQKPNGSVITKLETAQSLDWKQLMAEDPRDISSVEKSPVKYFLEVMHSGNSLRSTTVIGNEKERERVYDTIFRLPWRCELLINVGFLVCFDSFLSLLTIMPARVVMSFWRFLTTRQFKRPCAAELSDFSCLIVLAFGVTLLQETDISLIYHMIRGQGAVKLYVVYNVLEIFDKLCQNFGVEMLQTLFSSAEGLANCSSENRRFWLWRFIWDQTLAIVTSIAHSFILLAQSITLSTCIIAHNNALLALLVSNNFAEIKSNVFKRFSKDNIHSLVYHDSVERFHISAFLLFVLAQNILEAEGPWFGTFIFNALLVYVCEMIIDIIKHSFIAKFNEIKPIAFSEFLEHLCKQTLNIESEDGKKNLTFVPLGPACVVIRVLTPVYAAHLPYGPLPWRLLCIFILSAITYIMLASLKVMLGMGLRKHAIWYLNRCEKRKHHLD